MSNLEKLLDRKDYLLARLSRVKVVLNTHGTCITVGSGLDINTNEPAFSRIMDVLYLHEEECKEELRDIDRKINAINELLGGM
jgi:tRNA(Arg) A34 adenosine deaminase TadA